MSEIAQTEILAASIAPSISESGGGHGQKGVDFQRYWAIARIIELAHSDEPDFLVLFESLQDVVEFNHSVHPTSAKVYQVKTKNAGDWTWRSLTALPTAKPRKRKNSTELTVPPKFEDSPIGKLTRTLAELDCVSGEGTFVSNVGSSAQLAAGSTAGSLEVCKFSELSDDLKTQLEPELKKLKKIVPLESLRFQKTPVSPEDPHPYILGKVAAYLHTVAPKHVGQCEPFSNSLFVVLSARGRKTDQPGSFADLVRQRGYSKADLLKAVDELQTVPDQQALVNNWLQRLLSVEKMSISDHTRLQIEVTRCMDCRLAGKPLASKEVIESTRNWVNANPPGDDILPFLQSGFASLAKECPGVHRHCLQAILILEGIAQCLNQI